MKDLFTNHQYGVRASFILVCKSLALLIFFMICLLYKRQYFIYRSSTRKPSYSFLLASNSYRMQTVVLISGYV